MHHMKTEVRQLLQGCDEPTAIRIARDYPIVSADDRERIYRRLEQRMRPAALAEPACIVTGRAEEEQGHFWRRHALSIAACLVLCLGTAGALCCLYRPEPVPEPSAAEPMLPVAATEDPTGAAEPATEETQANKMTVPPEQPDPLDDHGHTIGERYAAANLTTSGTLWLTVDGMEVIENDVFVTVTLESEEAVSLAGNTQFMADNLMLSYPGDYEPHAFQCPYACTSAGENKELTLAPGERLTCTLSYRFKWQDPLQTTWPDWMELRFVTSSSDDLDYTLLVKAKYPRW